MKWINRIAYGTGQMLKDLVAGLLNIFSIVFFEDCIGLSSSQVGTLLLTGQLVNGIATPVIGFLSDKSFTKSKHKNNNTISNNLNSEPILPSNVSSEKKTFFEKLKLQLRLGRRKSWHLAGSILMMVGCPFMFGQPSSFVNFSLWTKFLINVFLFVCIQIGWAAVQIPHLSIINDLTTNSDERVLLASLRYFFSAIGDMSTFLVAYVYFHNQEIKLNSTISNGNYTNLTNENLTMINQTSQNLTNKITLQDLPVFRKISLIVTAYGALFVIIFHFGVRERKRGTGNAIVNTKLDDQFTPTMNGDLNNSIKKIKSTRRRYCSLSENKLSWYEWFVQPRFYLSCLIFSVLRLSVTISMLYIGPFLLHTLQVEKTYMVAIPLIVTVCCLLTSIILQKISKFLGDFIISLLGLIFSMGFCILALFCKPNEPHSIILYVAAILLGIGNTISNVRALTMVTTLIGTKQTNTAAFVHGIASLIDKLLTGLIIQSIQFFIPFIDYRIVEVFIVGSLIILSALLIILNHFIYSKKVIQVTKIKLDINEKQQNAQLQQQFDEEKLDKNNLFL